MVGRPISELRVGEQAEASRSVTSSIVDEFVDAVGDHNPLHSDVEYARGTPFGKPIAPGIWTAGLISGVIGVQLPGPGSLYISQSLSFLKPVFIGDTITARVEIAELVPDRNRARLTTVCLNQDGQEVLRGEAWVKPPKSRIEYATAPATDSARSFDAIATPWAAVSPWMWGLTAMKLWSDVALRMVGPAARLRSR